MSPGVWKALAALWELVPQKDPPSRVCGYTSRPAASLPPESTGFPALHTFPQLEQGESGKKRNGNQEKFTAWTRSNPVSTHLVGLSKTGESEFWSMNVRFKRLDAECGWETDLLGQNGVCEVSAIVPINWNEVFAQDFSAEPPLVSLQNWNVPARDTPPHVKAGTSSAIPSHI